MKLNLFIYSLLWIGYRKAGHAPLTCCYSTVCSVNTIESLAYERCTSVSRISTVISLRYIQHLLPWEAPEPLSKCPGPGYERAPWNHLRSSRLYQAKICIPSCASWQGIRYVHSQTPPPCKATLVFCEMHAPCLHLPTFRSSSFRFFCRFAVSGVRCCHVSDCRNLTKLRRVRVSFSFTLPLLMTAFVVQWKVSSLS